MHPEIIPYISIAMGVALCFGAWLLARIRRFPEQRPRLVWSAWMAPVLPLVWIISLRSNWYALPIHSVGEIVGLLLSVLSLSGYAVALEPVDGTGKHSKYPALLAALYVFLIMLWPVSFNMLMHRSGSFLLGHRSDVYYFWYKHFLLALLPTLFYFMTLKRTSELGSGPLKLLAVLLAVPAWITVIGGLLDLSGVESPISYVSFFFFYPFLFCFVFCLYAFARNVRIWPHTTVASLLWFTFVFDWLFLF